MNEHEEHQEDMRKPERFLLQLPPGHFGRRPFSALREALRGGVREADSALQPDLARILAGEPMDVEEVGAVLQHIASLGSAVHHCLHCAIPIHEALNDTMFP